MTKATDMNGKTCLVTGATSGIGRVTAAELARKGATVVMLCRSRDKGEATRKEIMASVGNARVELIVADMADLDQVRAAAGELLRTHRRLDVLINNAGGINSDRRVTPQGLEYTFAGNYLGHFLLTNLLLEALTASAPARIINVSSVAHTRATIDFTDLQGALRYSFPKAYGQSKLAQILFTYELAGRLRDTGVAVNALHPGPVASGFNNGLKGAWHVIGALIYSLIGISPEKGALTTLHLATSAEVAGSTGKYFVKSREVASSRLSYDADLRRRLWEESEKLIRKLSPA